MSAPAYPRPLFPQSSGKPRNSTAQQTSTQTGTHHPVSNKESPNVRQPYSSSIDVKPLNSPTSSLVYEDQGHLPYLPALANNVKHASITPSIGLSQSTQPIKKPSFNANERYRPGDPAMRVLADTAHASFVITPDRSGRSVTSTGTSVQSTNASRFQALDQVSRASRSLSVDRRAPSNVRYQPYQIHRSHRALPPPVTERSQPPAEMSVSIHPTGEPSSSLTAVPEQACGKQQIAAAASWNSDEEFGSIPEAELEVYLAGLDDLGQTSNPSNSNSTDTNPKKTSAGSPAHKPKLVFNKRPVQTSSTGVHPINAISSPDRKELSEPKPPSRLTANPQAQQRHRDQIAQPTSGSGNSKSSNLTSLNAEGSGVPVVLDGLKNFPDSAAPQKRFVPPVWVCDNTEVSVESPLDPEAALLRFQSSLIADFRQSPTWTVDDVQNLAMAEALVTSDCVMLAPGRDLLSSFTHLHLRCFPPPSMVQQFARSASKFLLNVHHVFIHYPAQVQLMQHLNTMDSRAMRGRAVKESNDEYGAELPPARERTSRLTATAQVKIDKYLAHFARIADPSHLCFEYATSTHDWQALTTAMEALRSTWTRLLTVSIHQPVDAFPYMMPDVRHRAMYSSSVFPFNQRNTITTKELLAEVDQLDERYQADIHNRPRRYFKDIITIQLWFEEDINPVLKHSKTRTAKFCAQYRYDSTEIRTSWAIARPQVTGAYKIAISDEVLKYTVTFSEPEQDTGRSEDRWLQIGHRKDGLTCECGITLGGLKKAKKRDESEDKWSE